MLHIIVTLRLPNLTTIQKPLHGNCYSFIYDDICCFKLHHLLFTETSSGLKNREMVDFILNRSLDALRDYIKCSYPDKPSRFAHILLRLPTLRSVCSRMSNESLFAQSFLNMAVPQVLSFILETKT